jgi:protein TonB
MSVQEVIMASKNGSIKREETYARRVRLAAVAALSLAITGFLFVRMPEARPYSGVSGDSIVTIFTDVKLSDPLPPPPPKPKPKLPVADPQGVAMDSSVGQHDWDDTSTTAVPDLPLDPVSYYLVEVKPRQVHRVVPRYPDLPRRAGIEGKVIVKAVIDTTGAVSQTEVIKSSGNLLLDEAALVAARGSRFTPARQQDRKVAVWVTMPFSFKLQ